MKYEAAISMLKGKQVLVTGATGFTGSCLVRKLVEGGAVVRAIARDSSRRDQLADLNIEWIIGDISDRALLQRACQGVNIVLNVAACYREAAAKPEDYYNVHVKATRDLAEICYGQKDFERFVHLSTVGVHGHIENPPANEDAPFSPGDIYQETKVEGELWIRNFAKEKSLPLVVLRPCAIYGPGDKRLLKVFRMAVAPLFPIFGSGKCLYHLIHVDDLAKAIIVAAVSPTAVGGVFIVGNNEAVKLEDFAKSAAMAVGKKIKVIRIPIAPLFFIAAICEFLCKPFGISPPIYRRRVAFYTKDRSFDTRRLRQQLGFTPEIGNEQGIKETMLWYAQNKWL